MVTQSNKKSKKKSSTYLLSTCKTTKSSINARNERQFALSNTNINLTRKITAGNGYLCILHRDVRKEIYIMVNKHMLKHLL